MGHSLRDAKVLGLSPSYEHTPQETERQRKKAGVPSIMWPLTHTHDLNASAFFLDLLKS